MRAPPFERLEARHLLTSVVSVDPVANSHTAPADTMIAASFDIPINPATVSGATFIVHGSQSGRLSAAPTGISVSDRSVSLRPKVPLKPGELVQVTATSGIEDLEGAAATPYVWQFRAASSGGTGIFVDSGQKLGVSSSHDVALGDLDGDGDLDAFVVNAGLDTVWFNNGQGIFVDSGQRLAGSTGSGMSEEPSRSAVALGDLDSDGDLDAVVVNSNQPATV